MPRRAKNLEAADARVGKRYPLNMRTTFEVRSRLEAAATESGRSLAQEAELQIERAFRADEVLARLGLTLATMERGSVEAALARLGFTMIRHPDTGKKAWLEPGYPVAGSGFIAPEEDQ